MVLALFDYHLMKHHTFSIRFKSKLLLCQSKSSTASRRSRSLIFAVCGVVASCKKMADPSAGGCQGLAQPDCRGPRKIPPSIHVCPGPRQAGVCNYGKGTTTPWRDVSVGTSSLDTSRIEPLKGTFFDFLRVRPIGPTCRGYLVLSLWDIKKIRPMTAAFMPGTEVPTTHHRWASVVLIVAVWGQYCHSNATDGRNLRAPVP